MKLYVVTLRRANGRFVKESIVRSKYAAKILQQAWEIKYDGGYYIEVSKKPISV